MKLSEEETLALCGREFRACRQGWSVYVQLAVVSLIGCGRSVAESASTPPEAA